MVEDMQVIYPYRFILFLFLVPDFFILHMKYIYIPVHLDICLMIWDDLYVY